ncbi:MAG: N-acetyl-gamma-glutamyl-phosphate reductase [Rhodospirillales bacterium]|nr:N-acetyl-gamma-glutamyl-phosphate reductase [Rhodospirillales bacterium]
MLKTVNVAIIGASGYTGAETIRLLLSHSKVNISILTADRKAGMSIGEVYPHLAGLGLPDMISLGEVDWTKVDFAFCCLPHGTTQDVIAGLPKDLKLVDLSADFRFSDTELYADIYGQPHRAPEIQKEVVYGLAEINSEEIKAARIAAGPGCYPTSAQLPLIPLLRNGQISPEGIIIDSKSGVSGAGRAPKEGTLYAEVGEGIHAYGIASHRHCPEIEQGLGAAHGEAVMVNFTPHLMPMNRGILSTIYVAMGEGKTADSLRETLVEFYQDKSFVQVLPEGVSPATRHVRGSNYCHIGVFADRLKGRAIIVSVIDNLVKGAAGQAVQCMNLMLGFEEVEGLRQAPMFP